jgi:energy-coupling factor transport system ATP-binding protein
MPLIEFRDVSFRYPESRRPALQSLSVSIEKGEYIALVGPNGSGKSSFLRLCNGLAIAGSGPSSSRASMRGFGQ